MMKIKITTILMSLFLLVTGLKSQTPYMVKDIWPGSNSSVYVQGPPYFTNMNGTTYFVADVAAYGREIWKTDGTSAGTVISADVIPGVVGTDPKNLTAINTKLFFTAMNSSNVSELWVTDGTTTTKITPAGMTNPVELCNVNGTLFFSAYTSAVGAELWKSDGTLAGTVLVKDIYVGGGSAPGNKVNMNGILYFNADDASGRELWRSDGTSAGTYMVKDLNTGGSGFYSGDFPMVTMNGVLYFGANDATNDFELWKSDGTALGTSVLKNIKATGSSYPFHLANINGTLFFQADDGTNGFALFKSDGTDPGTVFVKTVNLTGNEAIWNLTNVNGAAFFMTGDKNVSGGGELWKSDGTAGGTFMLKATNLGGSYIDHMAEAGGNLYFLANDPATGPELWKSDGTVSGTVLVMDINPGTGAALTSYLSNSNGKLFFTADNGTNGHEPWALDISSAAVPAAPSNLGASPTRSTREITLTWQDNSSNELGFIIERGPNGSSWTVIDSVLSNITVFADSVGLSNSTVYYYRVKAYNLNGSSAYSNTVNATTLTSTADLSKNGWVSIYPNPFISTATLKINRTTLKNAELKIYDVLGKEVKQLSVNTSEININREGLKKGIYFYKLINNNEVITTGKLVIQ